MSLVLDPENATPESLYIIKGSDREIYYFDTKYVRASKYLSFLEQRVPEMTFKLFLEQDSSKIKELW
jgi:hypothetical protein